MRALITGADKAGLPSEFQVALEPPHSFEIPNCSTPVGKAQGISKGKGGHVYAPK